MEAELVSVNLTKKGYWKMSTVCVTDRLCGLVVRVLGYRSRGPGFDSQHYQIFWEVVGLEWGPLSLVSTTAELLGRKSSGSGLENRDYGRMDLSRWPRSTLYPQKLALTLPTSGGRSVGIVHSRTKATGFSLLCVTILWTWPACLLPTARYADCKEMVYFPQHRWMSIVTFIIMHNFNCCRFPSLIVQKGMSSFTLCV
jgi:hypothetical protein